MTHPRRPARHPRTTVRTPRSSRLLGVLGVGLVLAASPMLAQTAPRDDVAPPARETPPAPCAECREGNSPRSSSDTLTITSDMKRVVPKPVMREQADFRLGNVLRNVPGVAVNR